MSIPIMPKEQRNPPNLSQRTPTAPKCHPTTCGGQLQLGHLPLPLPLRTAFRATHQTIVIPKRSEGPASYDEEAPINREENRPDKTPFVRARLQPCQTKCLPSFSFCASFAQAFVTSNHLNLP
jgi:hypothetical protein